MVGSFTSTELTKMCYAAAIGSKSIAFTLPSFIGWSLPSFLFWHMGYYYAPDKLKPLCQVCKYTMGAPFLLAGTLIDGVIASPEEKFLGEEVPLDISGTGGTIPADLGDLNKIRQILNDMEKFSEEVSKKTY